MSNETPQSEMTTLRANAEALSTVRRAMMTSLGMAFDGKRDLYKACGYPDNVPHDAIYKRYQRGDIAKAVVEAFPDGCWQVDPVVYDTDKAKHESPFEKAWEDLCLSTELFAELKQVDVLAGLGRYAVLYLGFEDSANLAEPPRKGSKLLYMTAFREGYAQISSYVSDPASARFGLPLNYQLTTTTGVSGQETQTSLTNVHWSRCIHVVDNRIDSKVFGESRLVPVWNRLQDIDTIMGGGAEGYWRAGFPGFFFGLDKEARWTEDSKKAFDQQINDWTHNLSRVIKGQGITPHPMTSQLQSPLGQLQCELWMVSSTTRIPYRILTGAEQGEMASTKDQDNWNTRIGARRLRYCDPYILRATIQRLIDHGALPEPKDGQFKTEWPSGREEKESEVIANKKSKVEMIAAYLSGGVEQMIPRESFMVDFLGMDEEEAAALLEEADAMAEEQMKQAEEDQAAAVAASGGFSQGVPPQGPQAGATGGQPPSRQAAPPAKAPVKGLRALWDRARSFLPQKEEPVGLKRNDRVEAMMPDGTKVIGKVIGKDLKGNALLFTEDKKVVALPEGVEE